ncbi:hypothetical protein FRB95_003490, partial [Tulasnella sp. JGI-2019a]
MTGPSPGGPTSPPPPCLVAAPMDMNTVLQETAEYLHTHNITTLALGILFGAMIGHLLRYGTSSSKLLDSMYR